MLSCDVIKLPLYCIISQWHSNKALVVSWPVPLATSMLTKSLLGNKQQTDEQLSEAVGFMASFLQAAFRALSSHLVPTAAIIQLRVQQPI